MNINIEQSIVQQKIIRDKKLWEKILSFLDIIFWLIMPFCLVLMLFNNEYHDDFPYLSYSLFWIPVIWYLYGIKYITKLAYLGKHDSNYREDLVNNFISDFAVQIIHKEHNLIILKKETGLFSWGKEITILISEDKLWANVTTLGRHDIKSPFHSYLNFRKLLSK